MSIRSNKKKDPKRRHWDSPDKSLFQLGGLRIEKF